MPLSATLNGKRIFSFKYNEESWESLKSQSVIMNCCDNRAVLKKSKLGTLFFAHYRKGHCDSRPESPEHIYLKNLVSTIALKNGWEVSSEHDGETPDGEKWTADVFCTNGTSKIAFEIQWSSQTRDEFFRRQNKYKSSGVRAAWIVKLRSNMHYYIGDIPYQFDTPVFGIKYRSKTEGMTSLYVPQFDKPVEEFVSGMLQGSLAWTPKPGDLLKANIIPHYENCWKCKRETGVVLGVSFVGHEGFEVDFKKFSEDDVPEIIMNNVGAKELYQNKIGAIKKRYSGTVGRTYISNGCFYCDALMGNFYLFRSLTEYMGDLPKSIYTINYINGHTGPLIKGGWYFDGRESAHYF
ncbi:competence protein CoiA [Marinimicrobium sp. C2-29]|uniref:competence protein CoiA n=1 Tax=Marinimicrobium sp. C2-29 TaxID=3139825 RepID=UPI0031393752